MDRIKLSIVTPGGTVLEKNVAYVNIPTDFGSVGILPNHAPMVCGVKKGVLRCRSESGDELRILVANGVASTEENEVTLLVSAAELP